MLMHFGHDCHCQQPFPDCFGCPVFELDIPQQWILDMPSSLEYAGSQTGSFYGTTSQSGTLQYTSVEYEVEYPDVVDFGSSTSLDIDDAPRASLYTPITECIWGSSGWDWYDTKDGRVVAFGSSGCSTGAVHTAAKGSDIHVSDCWQYFHHQSGLVPSAFSLGRTRTTITPTFTNCGTFVSACDPGRACWIRPFGIWATLRVISGALNLTITWVPRALTTEITYDRLSVYSAFRVLRGNSTWGSTLPVTSISGGFAGLYPYATSANNILGPGSIVYEKAIDCDEDFDGTPVVLPLKSISKARSISTQNTFEAVGISGIPSSVTITPV